MQRRPTHITLAEAHKLLLLDCEARGFTVRTLEFYAQRLGLFLRYCEAQGAATLADLTHTLIRAYLAHLQRRNLSSAYVHSHARAIRTFCNFLVREELLDTSPFAKVKMPKLEKKVLPALTAEELRAVLKVTETERDKAIVLVLLDTGLRATELCNVNIADVSLSSGEVLVRLGKGQKGRFVYLGARTRKQLHRYFALERQGTPASEEPLFVSVRGGRGHRLTRWGVGGILRKLRIAAGVPKLSPHALRRTMAIYTLRSGVDLYTLARMLGHADIDVLRQYLDIADEDVKTAAKRSGVVDNLL